MKIVVDFLPLMARGGGLQNARNLWRTILAEGQEHQWMAFARPDVGLAAIGSATHAEAIEVEPRGAVGRLGFQNRQMLRAARDFGADVIFTPMGVGPLFGAVPKVIGWHDSTVAYPEVSLASGLSLAERAEEFLRARLARRVACRAGRISVQTDAMATRLSRLWGVDPERFVRVPNGPSTFLADEPRADPTPPDGPPMILVVAEPKAAKNLEIVPAVLRRLREADPNIRMSITCSAPSSATSFGRALAAAGSPQIDFVGQVPHARLGDLYRGASVVLLPSWVESFSATYLEAMHFGVPLVVSDRDFAHAICQEAALYADPADDADLAAVILRVLSSPEVRAELREAGFRRLPSFPDWSRRLELYLAALEAAVDPRRQTAESVS